MSRRAALFALPLILIALSASSCARTVTLGYEEAVEVMVLDGVVRARATCIVSALENDLDLAKVIGLDVELTDDELALLAFTSSRCAPALATSGGVVGGSPLTEPSLAMELAEGVAIDVQGEVYRMVEEGLDPTLADCLIVELALYPEPAEILADDVRFSGMIVDCREPAG
jgi:hypothetical protein